MHTNIVVDLCCNHLGDINIAKEMIVKAKECGADYVKMQKRCLNLMSEELRKKQYDGPHSFGKTYGEHRAALEFSCDQWYELKEFAELNEIGFFATPFDAVSLFWLVDELDLKIIKMGSTQIHDPEMVDHFSKIKKAKIIMSTGMCDEEKTISLVHKINPEVVMQTTSAYPCDPENINLKVLYFLGALVDEVGLSGHFVSGSGAIEVAAVAMGATWIERHFTLNRAWRGTDQAASLEPSGLLRVVKSIRIAELAMGEKKKNVLNCELAVWNKIKGQLCAK